MRVLLISTYDLGRQPFGLASPAAWLARAGHQADVLDLAVEPFDEAKVRAAQAIAFHLPMHTGTRLAVAALPAIQRLNPAAPIGFYGLYAPVNAALLRRLGADFILGGEFEAGLLAWVERRASSDGNSISQNLISLDRLDFVFPDRRSLPKLTRYARLMMPDGTRRVVGATEASRGCKHLCRHCPIVPVYRGQFRIVQRAVVLEDVRRLVAAGAEHITFGDADFFNGPRHALEIVEALHREFPALTYDVTIKVEHLLMLSAHLRTLRETGCAFVTSAVESVDNEILMKLDKGHTRADFEAVVELCADAGLPLSPTFVAFTPWTTLEGYLDFLRAIASLGLIERVAPIQLAIRLLIPAGSRLLELDDVRNFVGPFDEAALVHPWASVDPRLDALSAEAQAFIQRVEPKGESRRSIFESVWALAHRFAERSVPPFPEPKDLISRAAIPYLTEPWYC